MAILNANVWNKAYMLEFLENGILNKCFTFSVPPESEELQFSQRISESKTFGGSVFDNYGNDTIKISLSGSTINEEKKLIYRGLNIPSYYTGSKEIFELQKLISDWNTIEHQSKGECKIYLYDLSKMNVVQLATGTATRNYWRVFIKDLKIKREKSKPNTYNYSLEMLGVVDEDQGKNNFFGNDISDFTDGFNNAMNMVESVAEYVEGAVALTATVHEKVKAVVNACEALDGASPMKILSTVTGVADSTLRLLTGNTNNTFYNSSKDCLAIAETYANEKCGTGYYETTKESKIENTDSFKVTFNSEGGSNVQTQTVLYSEKANAPDIPTKENYIFSGWYTESTYETLYDFNSEVTGNFTLYAKWTLAIATVRFNSRNGSSVPAQSVPINSTAIVPTPPTRIGYSFSQWCTDISATIPFDFATPIVADMTLYAAWQEVCTITFNSDGGSSVATQIVNKGNLATYPLTPLKENYTFIGWYSDAARTTLFNFSTPINSDTTLYANYAQSSNTVRFVANGGSSTDSQRVPIGGTATIPTTPTKTGCDFVYWCTDESCTNEFNFNTVINSNTTLYAKWTATTYTVTFDSDGGSSVESQSVEYNDRAIFPIIPTKENYVFEMWLKGVEEPTGEVDENGDPIITTNYVEFDFSTPITENITLKAEWFGGV